MSNTISVLVGKLGASFCICLGSQPKELLLLISENQLVWVLNLRAIRIPACPFSPQGLTVTGSWGSCLGNSDPAFTLHRVAQALLLCLTLLCPPPSVSSLPPSLPPLPLPSPHLLLLVPKHVLYFSIPKFCGLSFPLLGNTFFPFPLTKKWLVLQGPSSQNLFWSPFQTWSHPFFERR